MNQSDTQGVHVYRAFIYSLKELTIYALDGFCVCGVVYVFWRLSRLFRDLIKSIYFTRNLILRKHHLERRNKLYVYDENEIIKFKKLKLNMHWIN